MVRFRTIFMTLVFLVASGHTIDAQEVVCPAGSPLNYPQYRVDADVNYLAHTVDVRQTVMYTNRTGEVLEDLLFNVEANRWFDAFQLRVLDGPGGNPEWELDAKRLLVTLNEPLAPGCDTWVVLEFRLNVPLIGDGVYAPDGFLGYTPRQMNLGHWLPTVAVRAGDEWASREAVFIGEQEILEVADWDVTINLQGASPTNMPRIAAPGTVAQLGPVTWRYTLESAREFSLSISDAFVVDTRTLDDGTVVELYSFENARVHTSESGLSAPEFAVDMAALSLDMFADLFGAYPYDRMVVVQGDFPDGMEFSGLVFVGGSWFTNWPGGPESYLALITVHEVSHQWWYLRVGNDSALYPWLDEALSTYSEYIFLEEFYPELRDWWWSFRVNSYYPEGFVDSSVYEFDNARAYINAVYLRGVQMLHDLRSDIGTEAFFQLLADYVAAGDGDIAQPDLFWSLLTPEQYELTVGTRATYFREPQQVLELETGVE